MIYLNHKKRIIFIITSLIILISILLLFAKAYRQNRIIFTASQDNVLSQKNQLFDVVDNEYLIKFRDISNTDLSDTSRIRNTLRLEKNEEVIIVDRKQNLVLVRTTDSNIKNIANEKLYANSNSNGTEFQINSNTKLDASIEYIYPNVLFKTYDALSNLQWSAKNEGTFGTFDADIDLDEAHDNYQPTTNPIIAVIDTGVDINHPDLNDNILKNQNGEIIGYDFYENDQIPNDNVGHGTHVAGIAAAEKNEIGISGVCPNCKIMPLKAGDVNGLPLSSILQSFRFAIDNNAQIINNSWGCDFYPYCSFPPLDELIDEAVANNISVVFASGNHYETGNFPYPAFLNNVIAVSASDNNDYLSLYSNRGSYTDIIAPGGGNIILNQNASGDLELGNTTCDQLTNDWILSTIPPNSVIYNEIPCKYGLFENGETYSPLRGTSMAAPQVAGVLGLILAENPGMTLNELHSKLIGSADKKGDYMDQNRLNSDENYSRYLAVRSGRLNANNALNQQISNSALRIVSAKIEEKSGNNNSFLDSGEEVSISININHLFGSSENFSVKFEQVSGDSNCLNQTQYTFPLPTITGWYPEINFSLGTNIIVNQNCAINQRIKYKVSILDQSDKLIDYITLQQNINYVLDGWPVKLDGYYTDSKPVISDINNDNSKEIIVATSAGVSVFDSSGNPVSGWPQNYKTPTPDQSDYLQSTFGTIPVVGNVDNDPEKEILVAEFRNRTHTQNQSFRPELYINAWNHDGTRVENFDYRGQSGDIISELNLVDFDGNGVDEVFFSTNEFKSNTFDQKWKIHVIEFHKKKNAFTTKSHEITNYVPQRTTYSYNRFPPFFVGDINGDNIKEVIYAYNSHVFNPENKSNNYETILVKASYENSTLLVEENMSYNLKGGFFIMALADIDNNKSSELITFENIITGNTDIPQEQWATDLNIRDKNTLNTPTSYLPNWPQKLSPSHQDSFGTIADINNDNLPEIIIDNLSNCSESSCFNSKIKVFTPQGNKIIDRDYLPYGRIKVDALSADLSGNGIADYLMYSDPSLDGAIYMHEVSENRFINNGPTVLNDVPNRAGLYARLNIHDINNDKKNEILGFGVFKKQLAIYAVRTEGISTKNRINSTSEYLNDETNSSHYGMKDFENQLDLTPTNITMNSTDPHNIKLIAEIKNLGGSTGVNPELNFKFDSDINFTGLNPTCEVINSKEIKCPINNIKAQSTANFELQIPSQPLNSNIELSVTDKGRGIDSNLSNNSFIKNIELIKDLSLNASISLSTDKIEVKVQLSNSGQILINASKFEVNFIAADVEFINIQQGCSLASINKIICTLNEVIPPSATIEKIVTIKAASISTPVSIIGSTTDELVTANNKKTISLDTTSLDLETKSFVKGFNNNTSHIVTASFTNNSNIIVNNSSAKFVFSSFLTFLPLPNGCTKTSTTEILCNITSINPQQTIDISLPIKTAVIASRLGVTLSHDSTISDSNPTNNSKNLNLDMRFYDDLAFDYSSITKVEDGHRIKVFYSNVGISIVEKGTIVIEFNSPVEFIRTFSTQSCVQSANKLIIRCKFKFLLPLIPDNTDKVDIKVRYKTGANKQIKVDANIDGGVIDDNLSNNKSY